MVENSLSYLVYREYTAGMELGITGEAQMELVAAFKSEEEAKAYVRELEKRMIKAHVDNQKLKERGERCR